MRMAAADESLNQTPPPSYLVLMEEGLPSYEEAVMVGQETKQGMVGEVAEDEEEHCYLPSYRVEETEVAASKGGMNKALDSRLSSCRCAAGGQFFRSLKIVMMHHRCG